MARLQHDLTMTTGNNRNVSNDFVWQVTRSPISGFADYMSAGQMNLRLSVKALSKRDGEFATRKT
jgi:hypothetical protein